MNLNKTTKYAKYLVNDQHPNFLKFNTSVFRKPLSIDTKLKEIEKNYRISPLGSKSPRITTCLNILFPTKY